MTSSSQIWHEVWASKNLVGGTSDIKLSDLLKLNGYDSGADGIDVPGWKKWIEALYSEVKCLQESRTWLDVGCGSGLFLFTLPNCDLRYGVDYSSSLVQIANQYSVQQNLRSQIYLQDMSQQELVLPQADVVSCVSSLQYISKDEALVLFEQLLQHARQGVLLAEIPDLEKYDEAISHRWETLTYDSSDKFQHTYYPSELFDELASAYSFDAREVTAKLGQQSQFRWSRFFKKL